MFFYALRWIKNIILLTLFWNILIFCYKPFAVTLWINMLFETKTSYIEGSTKKLQLNEYKKTFKNVICNWSYTEFCKNDICLTNIYIFWHNSGVVDLSKLRLPIIWLYTIIIIYRLQGFIVFLFCNNDIWSFSQR